MDVVSVSRSLLHVIVVLLLFLVPLYVNRVEKEWAERMFTRDAAEQSSQVLHRFLSGVEREVRRSVARISLSVDLFLALLIALFPTTLTECISVLALITYALYRKYENTRKCPSCFSLIRDAETTCPECGTEIGFRWGIVGSVVNSNWLNTNSRFFRYKCS